MQWMAAVLYPDAADYDLYEAASAYFELFYHCELPEAQFAALTAHSVIKTA